MFWLRAQCLNLIILTVVGERHGIQTDNILNGGDGQKPMREEAHSDGWSLPQLDGGVAVLDVTVRLPTLAIEYMYTDVRLETQALITIPE